MPARILEGRTIAAAVRADLVPLARAYREATGRPATLAILHSGGDPASDVYTKALLRSADTVGVAVRLVALPADVDDAGLRAAITALNDDAYVQGILVELPLPKHLSPRAVAETIDPSKDVDGISMRNIGNLFLRQPSLVPSTCAAVVELLERERVPLDGARVVVVGASNVVGKPLAFMLLHRDATVTVCHIFTHDLTYWTRQADVLIVAVGKPGLITGAMVKPGATVVDVGINPQPDGRLVGDVDFASVAEVAGAVTPVPGGVGQLTNLMLLQQTLLAARSEGGI
jgi:methylenetetrahydrofolate dehydrogenase (NADP+)/methenyltetrahydrofolate cyclohydrolase